MIQEFTSDEETPEENKLQWLNRMNEIKELTLISIPRYYHMGELSKTQIHIFCDSSTLAYGAVAI